MDVGSAAKAYTLLTIGDGLVAQIPALIISIAAGMVVTGLAMTVAAAFPQQFIAQLFNNPRVLALTSAILGVLGLIRECQFRFPASPPGLGLSPGTSRKGRTAASGTGGRGAFGTRGSERGKLGDVAPLDVLLAGSRLPPPG